MSNPIMYAAQNVNLEVLSAMINSGYPLSLVNPDKKNLIHIICESGDYCVANYCISVL